MWSSQVMSVELFGRSSKSENSAPRPAEVKLRGTRNSGSPTLAVQHSCLCVACAEQG